MSQRIRSIQFVTALVLGAAALNEACAQAVSGNSPLREVQAPSPVQLPSATYEQSPELRQRCMPDSSFAPIRDKAGRNYQRQAEWRQLMQQGFQSAQDSYNWARMLHVNIQIQRQLPSAGTNAYNKPERLGYTERMAALREGARGRQRLADEGRAQPAAPQQPDLDYNFAVLDAAYVEIETAGYAHRAKLAELDELILKDVASSGRPMTELADLVGQFERFRQDSAICFRESEFGSRAYANVIRPAYPGDTRLPSLKDNAAFYEQQSRYEQAEARARELLVDLVDRVIADQRPALLRKIQAARSSQELAAVIPAQFGSDTLLGLRAAKLDPELKAALAARGAALEAEGAQRAKLEEDRRIAANRARIAAAFKSNGPATQGDVHAAVLAASMELSARKQQMQGQQISGDSYELTGSSRDDTARGKAVTLEVSDVACKPQNGRQLCSYSERLNHRIHRAKPFTNEVIEGGVWHGEREKRSGQFIWTAEGLVAARGEAGPLVSFLDIAFETFKVEYRAPSYLGGRSTWREESSWVNSAGSARLKP